MIMQARDIMTTNVVTAALRTGVDEIARLLLEKKISAVPIVDEGGAVLGIVSEGDLMRHHGLETERHQPWWLNLVASRRESAAEFVKSHGTHAEDVMTRDVVTVGEETSVGEIAEALEKRRIKRVPVVRDGKLVGVVSRANLLHALAAGGKGAAAKASTDDRAIRDKIIESLEGQGWVSHGSLNVVVSEGAVQLWGWVESEDERKAMRVAAEEVDGVRSVEDHLGTVPPWTWGA
jgi:CBS-domain-containing membrane protein